MLSGALTHHGCYNRLELLLVYICTYMHNIRAYTYIHHTQTHMHMYLVVLGMEPKALDMLCQGSRTMCKFFNVIFFSIEFDK